MSHHIISHKEIQIQAIERKDLVSYHAIRVEDKSIESPTSATVFVGSISIESKSVEVF